MSGLVAFVSGALFAVGLALAGMTQPAKVAGFLDFAGAWDPTLMFVMGGGVLVFGVAWRLRRRRQAPLLAPEFPTFDKTRIDRRLIAGAAIFGVGWALAGVCPGPGLVSLGAGGVWPLVFVAAMASGFLLVNLADRRLAKR